MDIEVNEDSFEERKRYLDNIPAIEGKGHKCYCGVWLCETPEELECRICKSKRINEEKFGAPIYPMGSALQVTRCSNCEKLIFTQFTPEGSTV